MYEDETDLNVTQIEDLEPYTFVEPKEAFEEFEDEEETWKEEVRKKVEEESKKGGKVNPWAVCTATVGREDKDKYERCVMHVKKQYGIKKEEMGYEDAQATKQSNIHNARECGTCKKLTKQIEQAEAEGLFNLVDALKRNLDLHEKAALTEEAYKTVYEEEEKKAVNPSELVSTLTQVIDNAAVYLEETSKLLDVLRTEEEEGHVSKDEADRLWKYAQSKLGEGGMKAIGKGEEEGDSDAHKSVDLDVECPCPTCGCESVQTCLDVGCSCCGKKKDEAEFDNLAQQIKDANVKSVDPKFSVIDEILKEVEPEKRMEKFKEIMALVD